MNDLIEFIAVVAIVSSFVTIAIYGAAFVIYCVRRYKSGAPSELRKEDK